MFKNYLTVAIRHLTGHKLFSAINIICLATGITFSLLIGVFVLDEQMVNSNIKDVKNQYVVKSKWSKENLGSDITTLGPLAKTMKDEYPGLVDNYYRFDPVVNIVSAGDKHFRTQISAGDTTLVTMFGLKLLYGNEKQAFRNNESAVVTESFAKKFFGKVDAIDKVITVQTPSDGSKHNFVITGVLANTGTNTVTHYTTTPYDVFLPMDANQYFQGGDKGDNWANVFMVSMLELKDGVTPASMQQAFAKTLNKYQPPFVKGNLQVQLAPMRTYYLAQNNNAVKKTLTTLSLVAIFILLLAVINFININIGTSAYRLKEIGLRKVFGSAKTQLILQYIIEAMALTIAAALISLGLYEVLRPVFNKVLQTQLVHFWQFTVDKIALLLVLVTGIGFLSGIYPAFVLSSTNTIHAVKGKINSGRGGMFLRKTLLVIQFTLAIMVFISTINVSRQVAYFFARDPGFNKEQVVVLSSLPRQWDSTGVVKMESAKAMIAAVPGVKAASLSYEIPDGNAGGYTSVSTASSGDVNNVMMITADEDFAKVYGLTMTEGVFLQQPTVPYQQRNIVLNESAVRALKLTAPVAGKQLILGGPGGTVTTIKGVVKDFNLEGMQKNIQPLVIANVNENVTRAYRYYSVKISGGNAAGTLSNLQRTWKSLFPDAGFEYFFMDEKFQALYQSELQLKKAAAIATALNLVIVFMGIFGVVAFTLTRRTKEIAVRKVMGADAGNIIAIFLKEYTWLIIMANFIAWPLAYMATNAWLRNYAYRIEQTLLPYLLVCSAIFIAVFILIVVQCFKAALANPVKSLRME